MGAGYDLPPAGNCCGTCKNPDTCKHQIWWDEQRRNDVNESAAKKVMLPECDHGYTNCSTCHGMPADYGAHALPRECGAPKDMINQPSHYNYGAIECIDAIKGMLGEEGFKAYCRGNAMKYTWRAGLKFDEVEDLKKASWYNRMAAGDDPRED